MLNIRIRSSALLPERGIVFTVARHTVLNAGKVLAKLGYQDNYQKETISSEQIRKDILISLRKIIQAIDIHSRDLNRKYGLTGPQLLLLQEIASHEGITVTRLAEHISLRQTTVTDIINRLERKELVEKQRDQHDKRRVMILLTEKCRRLLENAPSPLQDIFVERFAKLNDWEKLMILTAMRRVVNLMAADQFDAAPILMTGPVMNQE